MTLHLHTLQQLVAKDERFIFSVIAYGIILVIAVNLLVVASPIIGTLATVIYFLINGIFLECVFERKTDNFVRFLLGGLLLVLFLGLTSWMTLIIYNLDVIPSIAALVVVTTVSSFLNRRSKRQATQTQESLSAQEPDDRLEKSQSMRLRLLKPLYIGISVLLFCLVLASRSGEVYTVWEALHPIFIPAYFATTLILVVLIFSSERTEYKVLFLIMHSIVTHSLFVMIFPAGDVSGQQLILGITRRIYNNDFLHGYGGSAASLVVRIYNWVKGTNFQSACSVIFARMLHVDVFWTHLLLVPLLWSIFVPTIIFKITKTISGNATVSALAGLLICGFPEAVIWGTYSVTNSLGFIFFVGALYFMSTYTSKTGKSLILAIAFTCASLLSHYMTGVISLSLLILAFVWKNYQTEKVISSSTAKYSLAVAFILGASLLPSALIYHRLFSPLYARFSLSNLFERPLLDLIGAFVFGAYFSYGPLAKLVFAFGTALGCVGMLYTLRRSGKERHTKYALGSLFLITGFLMIFVDYRILKFFMTAVPFSAERLWVLRDFLLVPYTAIFGHIVLTSVSKKTLSYSRTNPSPFSIAKNPRKSLRHVALYSLVLLAISGWVTASLYYAYPHWAPLQITSYEIQAVKSIETSTTEPYVILGDMWITYTAAMFVGIPYNPNRTALFIEMRNNPSPETMIKAMEQTNTTVAYFIIQKLRLSEEKYSETISQAIQNGLQTYDTFDYHGQEKLHIFIHRK